ncbi:LicD family protein [Aliiglaciecola aliphaticivorans]
MKKGLSRRIRLGRDKFKAQKNSKLMSFSDLYSVKQSKDALLLKSGLPGFVYGPFRNVAAHRFHVEMPVKAVRLSLIAEYNEVLNFNHIAIWARDDNNKLYKVTSDYECQMSSVSKVLPDPTQAMLGDGANSVSVHSKREIKPWWIVKFDKVHHVAFIEFYNRKDKWGVRSKSMLLSCLNEKDKIVFQAGNVIKKGAKQAFYDWGLPLLEKCTDFLNSKGLKNQATEIEQKFVEYLTDNTIDAEKRASLLTCLQKCQTLIESDTPDLPNELDKALVVTVPADAKYLRVIGYRRKLMRPVTLKVRLDGSTSTLLEEHDPDFMEAHFQNNKCIWTLQHPHIFNIPVESKGDIKKVELWCDDFYSGDAFVQRQIQVSADNKTWQTIESTFERFAARLALLTAQEWLLGETWDHVFVEQLGHFLATYRMSQARTVKPLLRANRDLLPSFYEGVERGGNSASFLPPVIYTRHGLTIPFEHIDSAFLADRMKRFTNFLDENLNLQAFPCYGTLLGIHRDGDFLPHDDDIDLAVIVDLPADTDYLDATKQWAETLRQLGVPCRPPTPTSLNLHCYFEDFDMDLFMIYRIPDKPNLVWTHMEGYQTREVKRSLLEPISTLEFCGHEFYAPAKIEAFLEDRYGKGWVTPDPTFEL